MSVIIRKQCQGAVGAYILFSDKKEFLLETEWWGEWVDEFIFKWRIRCEKDNIGFSVDASALLAHY